MNDEQKMKLLDWALGEDTGASSIFLCRYMLGLPRTNNFYSVPFDSSDRGRCIRLLNLVPEWWDRLNELANDPNWKKQVPLIRNEANRTEK